MKSRLVLVGSTLLLATAIVVAQENLPSQQEPAVLSAPDANEVKHYSYAIGLEIGSSFHSDGLQLDTETVMAGLMDGMSGKDPKFDRKTCGLAMQKLNQYRIQLMIAKNQAFLVENGKAEGVKTLDSGLQYRVIESGDGATPSKTDFVKTHYRGKLIDGTEFDSSYARNEPAVFQVGGVIPGWTEALQLMKVGDKWELTVPSDLAYGESGAGGVIPPHATLIFEVELLGIESP